MRAIGLWSLAAVSLSAAPLPNVLWITAEDINPHLGCYGDAYAQTPHLDGFAATALRYRNVWSSAPVCAPARTALIMGVEPTSLGAEHMRSEVALPDFMRMYPQLLRQLGYYCCNNNKEDYNVTKPGRVWDDSSNKAHWTNRPADQPFFAVFNLGVSHESQIRARPHTLRHDPDRVRLPAYHPDTPEVRHDWAQYYDKITQMDAQFGRRLRELEEANLADQTIVIFCGDNGSGMPRSKRWPYNSGLNVPLLVRVPERFKALAPPDYQPGGQSDRLVSFVDFAPTFLSLADAPVPNWMHGRPFLGRRIAPEPGYIFGFRGRMDERYDLVRSVRNRRYIYIRNYMPHLIYGQYVNYMFQTPTTRIWKQLYDQGKLKPPQTFFWEPKPPEELYDLQADPDEVHNLASSPAHQAIRAELRHALRQHILQTRDAGFLPEAELHRRAAGTTIYETAQAPSRYPLDRILAMAELASMLEGEAVPELMHGLADPDSGVRYWAALGLLMRGSNAVAATRTQLHAALRDESPSVRIAAATALGQYSSAQDLQAALSVLRELALPVDNGAYVAIQALNAIDALGPKAAPLFDFLKTLPRRDPKAPARANEYVPRLLQRILNEPNPNRSP
jgi:arylsulfatase A-like enzyme